MREILCKVYGNKSDDAAFLFGHVMLSDLLCLILLHSRIAFVCMYVYMPVTDVGAVSLSDCACSLHTEVRILAIYAKYVAPPTKSMIARAIQKARRAAAKVSM